MTAAAIETLGLTKHFGRARAVSDLSLTIARGEIFGLLGPNGAGKTTAIKMLLGLVRPTSGAAEILGRPLGDRDARRRIGYLPELFRYPDWLTPLEVIDVHARLLQTERSSRLAHARDTLELVGLANRMHKRVGTFSKGMQQRLGLAVALTGDPDLIILDEPTSALDPLGRRDVRAIIEGLRTRGTAVLLNSHLLTEVERVCDRIAIVDRGTVVARGSLDAILGASSAVRLRLGNVTPVAIAALERYGTVMYEPPWIEVTGVAEAAVPSLITELVHAGAKVFAVDSSRASLEQRFIELLTPVDSAADDRLARPA